MLQQLFISNYALIRELSIDFDAGFSVITGETGAGKSILLGALGFVLGDRADTAVLCHDDKKCVVEAVFDLHDDELRYFFDDNDLDYSRECVLRRELTPQKKSRAFVNDSPVTLQLLRELGRHLVDIHSQHDSLLLTNADFQLALVDRLAGNVDLLAKYREQHREYHTLAARLDELRERQQNEVSVNDFLRFQLQELLDAKLLDGEYEDINQRLQILENAEEIKTLLASANALLNESDMAIMNSLSELSSVLGRLRRYADFEELENRLETIRVEIKDIAYEIERKDADFQIDEDELRLIEERVDLLNHLMFKHKTTEYNRLLEIRQELGLRVDSYEHLDDEISDVERSLQSCRKTLESLSDELHRRRVDTIPGFEEKVVSVVRQLAMPHAEFRVIIDELSDFTTSGCDAVRFMFSANKGVAVAEMGRVASGGELSRLMLSIKSVVSDYNYIPTLIFDEIDTGVSGEVASKLGKIMKTMAGSLQLIAITHLPQIASQAPPHFFVYKDHEGERTYSQIRKLGNEERVEEIAKMLSNDVITEEALQAARVLLSQN